MPGDVLSTKCGRRDTGWASSKEKVPELNSCPNDPTAVMISIAGQSRNGNTSRVLIMPGS